MPTVTAVMQTVTAVMPTVTAVMPTVTDIMPTITAVMPTDTTVMPTVIAEVASVMSTDTAKITAVMQAVSAIAEIESAACIGKQKASINTNCDISMHVENTSRGISAELDAMRGVLDDMNDSVSVNVAAVDPGRNIRWKQTTKTGSPLFILPVAAANSEVSTIPTVARVVRDKRMTKITAADVPAMVGETGSGLTIPHQVRPKQTVKTAPVVSPESVDSTTTSMSSSCHKNVLSELGLRTVSGKVAAIAAAKSALKRFGVNADDDFSVSYGDHQDAPDNMQASDIDDQDQYDNTTSLNAAVCGDDDSVMMTMCRCCLKKMTTTMKRLKWRCLASGNVRTRFRTRTSLLYRHQSRRLRRHASCLACRGNLPPQRPLCSRWTTRHRSCYGCSVCGIRVW